MYRMTRFGELLKALPRRTFNQLVQEHQTDKHHKGFGTWDQSVAMIYSQLSGCRSLRDLEVAFNSHSAHHYHLGTRPIKRSTLADANIKRDAIVYEKLCQHLLQSVQGDLKRDLGDLLYLLDSTPISLKGQGYDAWTSGTSTPRTQGLKVHVLFNADKGVPVYSRVSAPNVNDIEDARSLAIESGATYVFDKGYCDYNWWHRLEQADALFVTRFKNNAALKVEQTRPLPEAGAEHILADETVTFKNRRPGGKRINVYEEPLRRVVVAREDHPHPLVLATNDFERSAEEIAELYKARWGIELFFKWLKQHLKIKRFLGRSENAVKTQIYIAIITYLLIWHYHARNKLTESLKQCKVLLSTTLFQRPEIDAQYWRRRRKHEKEFLARQGVLL